MPEPTQIAAGGGLSLAAIFGWFLRRQIKQRDDKEKEQDERLNDHAGRLRMVEKQQVVRDDLDQTERRIKETIQNSFAEVTVRLGDIKSTAEKAHERIDDTNKRIDGMLRR